MTNIYVTIDTEYSAGLYQSLGKHARVENFARSIGCETPGGGVGISYQMDVFERHGLKGVFFVDPMPAMVWGREAIADIVGPIVERGHDVQLHLHAEWLALAGEANPLGNRTGRNMADFDLEDQATLIDYARDVLVAAGAPAPVAFRAGNYGANDDTLRALAQLGIRYETSHCPGITKGECAIQLGPDDRHVMEHCGVVQVPIGCIEDIGGGLRHAQLTALSSSEIIAAARHAHEQGIASFTLVSHSFELLSRDRRRINQIVKSRFEKLCAKIAADPHLRTATYRDNPPALETNAGKPNNVLPFSVLRAGPRYAEQAVGNILYGAA